VQVVALADDALSLRRLLDAGVASSALGLLRPLTPGEAA